MSEAGIQLLESLPDDEKHTDVSVLSALAAAKLRRGMLQEGIALLRQAAEKQPQTF
jgi:hypothetical protein